MKKFTYLFLIFSLICSFSKDSYSQEISTLLKSSGSTQNGSNGANFESSREKMIGFHQQKIVDHQKVLDCLKDSNSFESMNACNKHLEKYIKKDVDKDIDQ